MLSGVLPINDKNQKLKLKKNAMEFVDIETEKKNDPKYKTEMCKSWTQKGFCVYGNKCRFAHGRSELFIKSVTTTGKYKQKDCNSFKEQGFCLYGTRCNFKHDQRKLEEIERSYHSLYLVSEFGSDAPQSFYQKTKRLPIFENVAVDKNEECSSASTTLSPDYSFTSSTNDYYPRCFQDNKVMFAYPCFQPLMRRLY